jgi:hypothetical protein
MTRANLTPIEKLNQQAALKRLQQALADGTVKVVVGRAGSIAFSGWKDNAGVSDLCAYRSLANSPEMRRAVMRAEAMSGNHVKMAALISGVHSHDGGQTWGSH